MEMVEEPAAPAEKDRHDVQLELVEYPSRKRELSGCRAVHQDVLLPGHLSRSGHRRLDVVHISDERPAADVDAGGRRL